MTTTLKRAAGAATLLLVGATLCAAAAPADVLSGGITTHVVAHGETLFALAARLGVGVETLAADNGLDARRPLTVGQLLRVDNRHIVVSDAGHSAWEPGISAALVRATERFKTKR